MEIILFVVLSFYCIYLNLRIRQAQEDLDVLMIDFNEIEIKLYNKMMEIRKELKNEKSRRKSTKKRGRLSKAQLSESKILRKFRGDKNLLQTGGKG